MLTGAGQFSGVSKSEAPANQAAISFTAATARSTSSIEL
jgi:hypothetical protein